MELDLHKCRWCGHIKRTGAEHPESCLSFNICPPNDVHEIWPNVYLGVVEARSYGPFAMDGLDEHPLVRRSRWATVVGVLSAIDQRYLGSIVDMPPCPYVLIEHEDRTAGLIHKLGPAFDLADMVHDHDLSAPILFHCMQGASRSACALSGWMVRRGMGLQEVLERIFSIRPATAHFWPGWIPELKELEAEAQERRRVMRGDLY